MRSISSVSGLKNESTSRTQLGTYGSSRSILIIILLSKSDRGGRNVEAET